MLVSDATYVPRHPGPLLYIFSTCNKGSWGSGDRDGTKKEGKLFPSILKPFFVPVAVETLGVMGARGRSLLQGLWQVDCGSHFRPTVL